MTMQHNTMQVNTQYYTSVHKECVLQTVKASYLGLISFHPEGDKKKSDPNMKLLRFTERIQSNDTYDCVSHAELK